MKEAPLPESQRPTTFQLTGDSVSPTRLIKRDEDGFDIEETITCYPWHEKFVDRAGNVCDVVLCNARTTPKTNEAVIYREQMRTEWLRAGGLPLGECPYAPSGEYRRLLGTDRLVEPPKNAKGEPEASCSGHADGCVHMKAVIAKRQKQQSVKTAKQEAASASINANQLEQMGKVFGAQISDALRDGRDNLRSNRGEKD